MKIKTPFLPFLNILYINESIIVTSGHDCIPMIYAGNEVKWYLVFILFRSLIDKLEAASNETKNINSGRAAFDRFREMDSKAQSTKPVSNDASLTHYNAIT